MPSLQRTGKEIAEIYNRQVDTVYRICFSYMKNTADTEDMVQETFLRLLSSSVDFVSQEHEKAWLIVTASNLCKDTLKKWWRKTENIEDPSLGLNQPPYEIDEVLDVILRLPENQKMCSLYVLLRGVFYCGYCCISPMPAGYGPKPVVESPQNLENDVRR